MTDFEALDAKYHRMYFNTGVRPWGHIPPIKLFGDFEVWRGGTKQIICWLEEAPPEGYELMYLVPDETVGGAMAQDAKYATLLKIKVVAGGMLSDWAVFKKVKR